ncbi:hypothetical protein BN132_2512 [Cronobacter turicensis 564]|nr:hypothetical protein BN132_2512 [Cronobacter turicensis 564]
MYAVFIFLGLLYLCCFRLSNKKAHNFNNHQFFFFFFFRHETDDY